MRVSSAGSVRSLLRVCVASANETMKILAALQAQSLLGTHTPRTSSLPLTPTDRKLHTFRPRIDVVLRGGALGHQHCRPVLAPEERVVVAKDASDPGRNGLEGESSRGSPQSRTATARRDPDETAHHFHFLIHHSGHHPRRRLAALRGGPDGGGERAGYWVEPFADAV